MTKESSSFVLVMSNTPFIRVVDFLLENRPFDYSKTQIAKNAEVGWSTPRGIWKVLERAKIVKRTRAVGKSKMYKLNEENPIVRKLIELDANISDAFAEQIIEEELKKVSVSTHIKK
jgi:DNA-binding transcriptional ArsR family regulator